MVVVDKSLRITDQPVVLLMMQLQVSQFEWAVCVVLGFTDRGALATHHRYASKQFVRPIVERA